MTTKAFGENGFRWFFGRVVEREKDPLKLGRVKVRVFGIHDDQGRIPDDKLPWATLLIPPFSAASNQVGVSPLGLMVGSVVFGFFLDGNEAQLPMILGALAGIPDDQLNLEKSDVAKLTRGENDLNDIKTQQKIEGQFVAEPASPFAAKYPFNKVIRSETGHVFEIDDTPGAERIHSFHKSGSYTEIDKDGNRVDKIVGDGFEVVVKNKNVYVGGMCNIEVAGTTSINITRGDLFVDAINGRASIHSSKEMSISSDAKIVMVAPEIHLNPNSGGTSGGDSGEPGTSFTSTKKYAGFVQPNIGRHPWGT